MSYIAYNGLRTPNEVISKMHEYIQTRGYNIIQPLADDLNIYDMSSSDGKKFAFANRTGDYFINLRSANGTQIFGTTDDATMDITTPDTDENYTGVGMTVSEGYSATVRWYNQYKVPLNFRGNEVQCVFMPMKVGEGYSYTLYCNNVTNPTDTIVFTLFKENDSYRQCSHLVYADISKYDLWTGGALFSGSATKAQIPDPDDDNQGGGGGDSEPLDLMRVANKCYEHDVESDRFILPVLSSGSVSNTFLRIDIDGAPSEVRGQILWASSGTDNITGKKLSMPIRLEQNMNGKIPNYYWLQSRNRLDWGRNINTLNGITIDMPIFAAVLVDPDALDNYAAVGDVSGVYCISTLNTQTSCTYERSYPTSGQMCQVFPHGKRRGHYGFDGISIKQEL